MVEKVASSSVISQEQFLSRLRKALGEQGDFPTSAKIVSELKRMTSDPNVSAEQVAEVILREPSLGVRVLHVVNSSFFRRSKPILTISQAVIHVGMKALAELCAGLVLLQKFGSIVRRGHAFSQCLTRTVLTSLLTASLSKKIEVKNGPGKDEYGYLAGSLAEMGSLLLAYYFPELYESAAKRAEVKKSTVTQAITELVGLTPLQLTLEVVSALQLPDFYREILLMAHAPSRQPEGVFTNEQLILLPKASRVVAVCMLLSEAIATNRGKEAVDAILARAHVELCVEQDLLVQAIAELSSTFKDHCAAAEINLPSLPDWVSSYSKNDSMAIAVTDKNDPFMQFIEEIRHAVDEREPSSTVVTTVMETLAWGLGFDRVMLLLLNGTRRTLVGKMALGSVQGVDPRRVSRPVGNEVGPYAPDSVAIVESRPVFSGDSILPDGWPFVSIPIGFGENSIGVIYADRTKPEASELSQKEQAAIGVLAELLDRSVTLNG